MMQDEADEQLDAPQFVGHQKPGKPQPTSSPSCMQIPLHVAGLIFVTSSESDLKQRLDTRSGKALHTQLPITVSRECAPSSTATKTAVGPYIHAYSADNERRTVKRSKP